MGVIEYRKGNKIAVITINRPDAMEDMNLEGWRKFHDILVNFRDNDGIPQGF